MEHQDYTSLPLDIKYRPRNFDGIIKGRVVRVIESLLKSKQLPRLLNLSGPPGVGKTTLVFLISKALQCESEMELICDKCPACKAINESGLFETGEPSLETGITIIDMGLKSSEEYLIDIAESIKTGSIHTKNKIIIIEEMQRTSKSSQDILLRSLEFIPDDVYILITGAHNALNPALSSRAQRFNVPYPDEKSVYDHVIKILKKEGLSKKISATALRKVIRVNGCNVRKILKQLDLLRTTEGNLDEIIDYITGEMDYSDQDYINFFKNTFGNLNDIIQFLESLTQPSLYLARFKYFLENVFKFYLAKIGVEKNFLDGYRFIVDNYSLELLFDLFNKILELGYINNDSDAKLHLLNIAFKLNTSLNTPNLQQNTTRSVIKEMEEQVKIESSQLSQNPKDLMESLGIDLGVDEGTEEPAKEVNENTEDEVLDLLKDYTTEAEVVEDKEELHEMESKLTPMGSGEEEDGLDWVKSFIKIDEDNNNPNNSSKIMEYIDGDIVDINSL